MLLDFLPFNGTCDTLNACFRLCLRGHVLFITNFSTLYHSFLFGLTKNKAAHCDVKLGKHAFCNLGPHRILSNASSWQVNINKIASNLPDGSERMWTVISLLCLGNYEARGGGGGGKNTTS